MTYIDDLSRAKKAERDFYNKDYAKDSIDIALDNLKDLSLWSTYNEDRFSDLIVTIIDALKEIRGKI
jgi:hypothetical protein